VERQNLENLYFVIYQIIYINYVYISVPLFLIPFVLILIKMFVGVTYTMENVKEQEPMENVKECNHETFVSNVETTTVKPSMIESTKTRDQLPQSRYKPCHGWISSDDDNVDLIYFPPPPLPKHIEELIGKSVAPERPKRKNRWDEKPDDM
jgi:hypothetical protein